MKIKKGCEASTDDFWYDLIDGGYLNPEDILEDKEDVKKVLQAIEVIQDFAASCDEQIEGFIR
jgi:hypothetical protein